jgi:N-acetylmuramoyl-L-alanine amidase
MTRDGRTYVPLDEVASSLDARSEWTRNSVRARLTVGRRVVVVTRNWSQVLVDGKPLVMSAPAVVTGGAWWVPRDFLAQVGPRLAMPPVRLAAARDGIGVTATPAPSKVATFGDLRVRSYPSFTRVVVESDMAFAYSVERQGTSVKVRLTGLSVDAARAEEVHDPLVAAVRLDPGRSEATLSVRLESAGLEVRATTLADPFRLVLDFGRPAEPDAKPAARALRTIVLDAGHGGHDSGAVGPTGLMEKDLVLDVTRRVAKLVEERLGIKVLLSRGGDHFVTLRDRTSFANRERADLFVSIHANAHPQVASEGVETYFLSSEATDNAARQAAARENSVVQLETPAQRQKTDVLRTILWDLAQSDFQAESSMLAETIQDAMTTALRIPNRGVKQAGFYVLGGAAMPAVLIEIGFVTNPREERRLKDGRYRDEIAAAIFSGLAEYRKRYDQRMRPGDSTSRAR